MGVNSGCNCNNTTTTTYKQNTLIQTKEDKIIRLLEKILETLERM